MSDYYYYDGGYYEPEVGMAVAGFGVALFILLAVCLVVSVITLVSYWKLLVKAGKPGWASLIPFYNTYKIFEVTFGVGYGYLAFVPLLAVVINFIPILGQIVTLIIYALYIFVFPVMFVKRYGASTGFAIGAILLPVIFYPILAFSSVYQYMGPIGVGPFGMPPLGGNKGYVGGDAGYNGQNGYYNGQNGYYNGQNNFNGYAGGQVPNSNWNGNYSQPNQAGQPAGWGQNPQGQRMNLDKNGQNGQGQGFGQSVQDQNTGRNYGPQGGYGQNPSQMGQNPSQMGQRLNQMGQRPQSGYPQNPGQGQMGQRPQNFNGYNQNNGYRQ